MRFVSPLLLVALASCDPTPAVERGPCVPDRVRHVERFGYYAGAPYLAELASYSNLSWGGGAATLSAARAAGVQAVIDVQGIFRISAASPPAESAIAASWTALADQLRPDLAALAALYPSDEPYMNGEKNGVAPAEVQRRLEAAAALVHATPGFEHVRIAAIFSERCLDILEAGQAGMPAGYDWVGWDLYAVRLDYLEDRLNGFLAFVRPDQRVIAVPDAFVWRKDADLQDLETLIAFWLKWIEDHPQVVAVAPYIYQSGSSWIGARDLPFARLRYEQIGGCILAANGQR
jgi:hypothetical protein